MNENVFPFPDDLDDFNGDINLRVWAFSLTVAEAKRLIAKGIAADPRVQDAMEHGMVAVCKGSTNAYVAEELLGGAIEMGKYVLGRTVPTGEKAAQNPFEGAIPEFIFRDGKVVEGLTLAQAVREMSAGDVVIKGANALDYASRTAGVLIGHPEGGTVGSILGCVYGKGLELIIPIGLEKQIATPAVLRDEIISPAMAAAFGIPRMWPLQGSVFTELEACLTLGADDAFQYAAGGVCGAEGASWILVSGSEDSVQELEEVVDEVRGEPSFLDAVLQRRSE
jgi:hypothetical protein